MCVYVSPPRRALRDGELFEIVIQKMVDRWSGSIEAGEVGGWGGDMWGQLGARGGGIRAEVWGTTRGGERLGTRRGTFGDTIEGWGRGVGVWGMDGGQLGTRGGGTGTQGDGEGHGGDS